jgi:predicted glutamine amidotransferase
MCRLLGYATRTPHSVGELLGDGFPAFTGLSRRHPHGWGIAWSDPSGQTEVAKAPEAAHRSDRYRELATGRRAAAGVVHLRWASTGMPLTEANTHPFTAGGLAFAHNGLVKPADRLEELIAPELIGQLRGGTDSERYFLALRTALRDADLPQAVGRTVAAMRDRLVRSSLNAVLLTPDRLIAVCEHDERLCARKDECESFVLRYRVTAEAVTVASSGWLREDWPTLPNGSMLVVDRATLATSVLDLSGRATAAA